MKTKLYALFCGLLFSMAVTAQTPNCSPIIGGYYPFWAIGGPVNLDGLTHAYYGFIGPNADGSISNGSVTAMNYFLNSAKQYPDCKLLASVGTQGMSAMAKDDNIRATFCNNLKNFCITNGFNGIDVDWESIDNATDKAGYTAFMKSLRQAFTGTDLLIVATLGFGNYWMQWIENDALAQADYMNIMIYDQTGTWAASPYGQHSSFDHYLQAESYWVGRGINRNFMVKGLPFYGYKFNSTSGGIGTAMTYAEIDAKFPNLSPDADQTPDPDYTFFNGPTTIKKKVKYAIDNGFKGVFVWTMPQDASGSKSLFAKILEQFAASCPGNSQKPVVSITSPANNATFTTPATITISADATDADGTISKVDFYNGSSLLYSDDTAPYSYDWIDVAEGTYYISARATDDVGNTGTSVVSVSVNVPQAPYGGTRASIPGTIELENYDLGGQNVAFNDLTPTNQGGAYRTDAVDIEAISAGGFDVGYIQPGEWMKYMVNVTTDGKYKIEAYVAATAAGKTFTLDLDGTTIATVNVPNTGGWQTWQVVTIYGVDLTAGDKILKFNATSGDFNVDKIVLTMSTETAVINNTFDSELQFYPNPVQNVIYFSKEVSSVKVMDMMGNVLDEYQNDIQNIDLSNYSAGCYILIAQYKDRNCVYRVVKK
jgi:GH18 family chitinase